MTISIFNRNLGGITLITMKPSNILVSSDRLDTDSIIKRKILQVNDNNTIKMERENKIVFLCFSFLLKNTLYRIFSQSHLQLL